MNNLNKTNFEQFFDLTVVTSTQLNEFFKYFSSSPSLLFLWLNGSAKKQRKSWSYNTYNSMRKYISEWGLIRLKTIRKTHISTIFGICRILVCKTAASSLEEFCAVLGPPINHVTFEIKETSFNKIQMSNYSLI